MRSGIYTITSPSGGVYVGSAVDVKARWRVHRHLLGKRKHHSRALQRAHDKYGLGGLTFEIVDECRPEQLVEREQSFIDRLKPRYNCCATAGSQLGRKHSEASKAKNAAAHIGKPLSEAHRAAIAKANRDNPKVRLAQLGKRLSEEHKAKTSLALRGKKHRDGFEGTLTPDRRRSVVRDYRNGAGLVALERKYRTTHHCLRRLLREEGVEIRPRGGRKNGS